MSDRNVQFDNAIERVQKHTVEAITYGDGDRARTHTDLAKAWARVAQAVAVMKGSD